MGRNKSDDPKKELRIWVKGSVIEKNGGVLKTKEKAISYLDKEALNNPQTNKKD